MLTYNLVFESVLYKGKYIKTLLFEIILGVAPSTDERGVDIACYPH